MKIALAQLNYIIGDFEGNTKSIIRAIHESKENGADLVIFSELSICGYPPLDMLEHKSFVGNSYNAVERIALEAKGIAVIIGAPAINTEPTGKNLNNAAYFLCDGKIKQEVYKSLLPTYDIFDEYRYFQPNKRFEVISFMGKRFALTICEDLWFKQPLLALFGKHELYTVNPMEKLYSQGCNFVVNIAASPFAYNHDQIKTGILAENAEKYKLPIFYVNQVGAHTELIFDGASRVVGPNGKTLMRMDSFAEGLAYFELEDALRNIPSPSKQFAPMQVELIHDALVMGIRDYFMKMNFSSAVLGLSGGIDSAVTLALACDALGAKNLRILLLPSQYSSDHSIADAKTLAENLGVRYDIISIKDIFSQFITDLDPLFNGHPSDLAEENIQARVRGTLLMAVSNKFGNILLNTSNKSEVAVGYGTLYGDMNGGLSVLGDVYKTDVYRLARFINRTKEIIPENSITKPPSAELRPDQKDSDSLPDYELLDKVLFNYIELRKSSEDIINEGFDEHTVKKIIQLVNRNEYKRFQTPPILRVSSKAFGSGRRMPLVAKYS